jgi:hypothetical protein
MTPSEGLRLLEGVYRSRLLHNVVDTLDGAALGCEDETRGWDRLKLTTSLALRMGESQRVGRARMLKREMRE